MSATDPIHVADAERALLGAVLAGFGDIDTLAEIVEPSDFYQPRHEAIWDAILRVHRAGNHPEPAAVRLALASEAPRHDPAYLIELSQSVVAIGQAVWLAEQVAKAAGFRRMQAAGVQVAQIGGTWSDDLDAARERARGVLDAATTGRVVSRARSLAQILDDVIDAAEKGRSTGLATCWPDLDRLIGGLAPGRLVVFGARPGGGKSLAGVNLALHMAHRHDHAALVASLEMPEDEIVERLLSAYATVDLSALHAGTLDEAAWKRVAIRRAELDAMPITIVDSPGLTVSAIQRHARDIQRRRDDLALIVVDYLQLVRAADSRASRVEQLGQISRDLKLLARETGACVVAMAQVNREGAKRTDGKPMLTDLRESGSIEADADQVILMHQPDADIPEVELNVEKNRHGPRGHAKVLMQGHYARLVSVGWTPSRGLSA